MGKVQIFLLMVILTQEITVKASLMEKEYTNGRMEAYIPETLKMA